MLSHFVFVFYQFFLKLIVSCRLCAICLREYNHYSVHVIITRLIWITWTSRSVVRERLINAITHWLQQDEPSASLVTTTRIYNVYQFTNVVSLLMCDVHWFLLGIKLLLLNFIHYLSDFVVLILTHVDWFESIVTSQQLDQAHSKVINKSREWI